MQAFFREQIASAASALACRRSRLPGAWLPGAWLLGAWLLGGCASTRHSGNAAEDQLPVAPLTQLQGLVVQDTDGAAAEALRRYASLPGYKAAAIALATDGRWAVGAGQHAPHQLAAVQSALTECETRRAEQQLDAPCELLRLDDEEMEIGRAMRLRLQADRAETPALIWRFSSANAVLYLAGSIHAQRATALPLAPVLTDAYIQADMLLVELDITAIDAAQQRAAARQSSVLPPGQSLEQTLPPRQLQQFRALATELGVPWEQLNGLRPGAAMNVVAVTALQTAGLDPSQGVENLLLQRAHAEGKKVESLETYAQQVELLSDAPVDSTVTDMQSGLSTSALRAGIRALNDAWMRADMQAVLRMFTSDDRDANSRSWTARLLDARNLHMAQRAIEHLQQRADRALMLVGAGHLPGSNGIVALLERAGFSGTQLTRGGEPLPATQSPPQQPQQPQQPQDQAVNTIEAGGAPR